MLGVGRTYPVMLIVSLDPLIDSPSSVITIQMLQKDFMGP